MRVIDLTAEMLEAIGNEMKFDRETFEERVEVLRRVKPKDILNEYTVKSAIMEMAGVPFQTIVEVLFMTGVEFGVRASQKIEDMKQLESLAGEGD